MTDAITMDHHASAERFLQLAVSASVYLTSPSFTEAIGSGGKTNNTIYSSGLMKWHRSEKKIRKKWGMKGLLLFQNHVVLDVWTDDNLKNRFSN